MEAALEHITNDVLSGKSKAIVQNVPRFLNIA